MKRMGPILAVVATMAFAGPVSANHEIFKANLQEPGVHGTITVTLNDNHTQGEIAFKLDGLKDGDAAIGVNAGPCWKNQGNIVLVWVTGKDFPNGDRVGTRTLPAGSAYPFKDGMRDHDMVSVTVRNEGRAECRLFERVVSCPDRSIARGASGAQFAWWPTLPSMVRPPSTYRSAPVT